ncbi:FIST C-terminal domain-containing protein [Aquihabitans sp. G128]|uniref:FIST signal transduction protein n=1 Tax=Aquihabitans sp. G128 TaxID=2849779 RepID=UPI001C2358D5|nr:FIST N-terminal domain-containing protein [Aquihabitans sp. G128]QXC62055.1 FIST C-terminal domain-containing protein [Aquihabitans sp. G128]
MGFAAAISEHPLATHAIGEVVGQVLDQVGEAPDLAVLFVTGAFAGATEDLAHAVRELLHPAAFVACTAASVLAGDHEVEQRPAVVLFTASWSGRLRTGAGGARAVRFSAEREGEGWRLTGTDDVAVDGATLVLLADPFSFPVDGFLEELSRRAPGLTVVGGLASAAAGAGGNRLVADDVVVDRGAVGIYLPPGVPVRALVSQGCRPVGEPLVVTRSSGTLIEEIAGRPALDRVLETADAVSPEDRSLMARGLHLGVVIDETQESFAQGDFLIRDVLGADRTTRAVAVGTEVAVGSTIQFHVRDADSADLDLRATLAGEEGRAALVFTCDSRGAGLFGEPDHDATVVNDHLDGGATAGMFCAGEIGPVGDKPWLHAFTTTLLLFDD